MKFVHLADLHLGRKYGTEELITDQRAVLEEIAGIIRDERADAVLISGDIYDRSVPPEAATVLFDEFTDRLEGIPLLVISGNHDSGERVSQWSRKLEKQGIHLAGTYRGSLKPVEIGGTAFYLMPYLDPVEVRRVLRRTDLHTMQEATDAVLATLEPTACGTKVLLAHLFAVPAGKADTVIRSESESASVGGIDSVEVGTFDAFDYVALGHLHGPQAIGRETVRYAGSPLMYSFSEENQKKSVTVVELGGEAPVIRQIPLRSGRRMRRLRGTLEEILRLRPGGDERKDFILAELTDPDWIESAQTRLETVYESVQIRYVSREGENTDASDWALDQEKLDDPLKLFEDFFVKRNGKEMTEAQRDAVKELLENAEKEGDVE